MAVAFRSAGALAVTNDLAPAIPYPAGLAANDLLLLQFACIHTLTPTTPAGWTKLLGPVAMAGTSPATDGHIYWKVAAGSESGSLTVTLTGTSNWAGGVISAYSGVSTSAPIDSSATAVLPTSGNTATAPSVTTVAANTQLLHIYWGYVNNSTVTPNAADSERYDAWNISINLGYELADKLQAASGATGTSAATWVGSALFGGLAATVALAPASSGGGPIMLTQMGVPLGPVVTGQALPLVSSAGALEASRVLAPQKAVLFGLNITNTKASAQYILLHDASALPAEGATPAVAFTVPASTSAFVHFGLRGIGFANGIVVCNSSTAHIKTIGAADCVFAAQVG
jgi:hypothetical protein